MAPVLVHFHIFKNAGTSIDAMLRASLGNRWGPFEGKHATDVQDGTAVASFLARNPSLRAISTHLGRPPPPPNGHPIVFLRDPILRAISVYSYVRENPAQDGHRYAIGGLKNYFQWALESDDGGVVIRDYQVIHLSAASFRGHIHTVEARDDDLSEAKATVDGFGFVGVVERFGQSLSLYRQRYGRLFPSVTFEHRRENQTGRRTPMTQDVLAFLLGSRLFQRLRDVNQRDQQLYDHAVALLDQAGATHDQHVG